MSQSQQLTLPAPTLPVSSLTLSSLTLPVLTLEQRIQRWVQLDNQIKQANDQVRALRESRNDTESSILTHVANHNLSHATVRIKDGTLRFAFNVKHPPAITLAFLGEALAECCPPQQAAAVMQHIRAKRDAAAKLVPEIRRTGT
jgi:hypothetical protein